MSSPITIQTISRPFNVDFGNVDLGIPPIPGSKSMTNRALLLAALAESRSTLTGVLFSDDTRVMMNGLEKLGVKLEINKTTRSVHVRGRATLSALPKAPLGRTKLVDLNLGNAGTATRFLTAACAASPGLDCRIDGVQRMRERSIHELVDVLVKHGAKIIYEEKDGFPPLRIEGKRIKADSMEMRASVSSQYVSAVLMASTLFHKSSSADFFHLKFDGAVVSWPYVEITLGMMRAFGVDAHATEDRRGILIPATGMFQGRAYLIEPDASNASYFLAAAALIDQSYCCISHLGPDSLQGDAKFYRVLRKMGARAWSRNKPHTGIRALGGQLRGIDIGLNDMPDMAQTLAVIALFAQGPTIIRNVGNLRVKETDRIEALRIELTKLGAEVRIMADDIHIMPPKGNTLINAANGRPMSERNPVHIDTYDDHRMAMAFSIAGLKQAGLWINNPECVNKTFPDFFKYLKYLHVNAKG